jgi:hypothetical protein
MNFRPHPFILALFVAIFLFDSLSICLYGVLVGKNGVSAYEIVHLIMSSISISTIIILGIYLQYTRHRTKPFKIPYILTFGAICLVNLALSISVSIKAAGQGALCSVFSSFPSNQDCKWGGISIILPWVTTIFGAGGLVCIVAEKQVGPVELLRKEAREDLERLRREWLKGCYEENLKRSSHSIDSEREEVEVGQNDDPFDPYALANVAYPDNAFTPRQTFPMDLWRHDPGPILPRQHPDIEEEDEDFYADEDQYEPRSDIQYHDAHSDRMSLSQPDTDELNDVLDIRSLVYLPSAHPTMEDVHSATANLSDLNSHLLGRLTPSDVGSPEPTVEETSCWEDEEGEEEVGAKKKRKLRPRRLDSGSVRPPKKFVVRFEDPPSRREPLTIIVTPPTPLPNNGYF